MCEGLEKREWPVPGTEIWLEPKLWPVMGDRWGPIHAGPTTAGKEFGFDPKENGEPLKSLKKESAMFDLGFKRQSE